MLTALPLAFLLSLLSPATYEFLLARTMLLRLLLLAPLLQLLSPTLPLAVSGAVIGAGAAAGAGIIVV